MNTALRVIRILCVIVFVSGIAGLIISSIAGNNVGVVTTIGLITSLAAVILLTASTVANRQRIDAFNDALAEQVEAKLAHWFRVEPRKTPFASWCVMQSTLDVALREINRRRTGTFPCRRNRQTFDGSS